MLYEDALAYEKAENRKRQRAFREFTGIDKVAHELMKVPEPDMDPGFEMNFGVFEHGGTRQVIYYFDKNWNRTGKADAAIRTISELDEDAHIVWKGTEIINKE